MVDREQDHFGRGVKTYFEHKIWLGFSVKFAAFPHTSLDYSKDVSIVFDPTTHWEKLVSKVY